LALTPGIRLGVYEVVARIGEGGMGQVFRARDTKLDRDVAIKILPEAFAHDADRLARFQREAKTLASLNHPNVAAIYGLDESGGMTALVMELVEGDDLSQRVARSAIPLDEALRIARQIAEALEAAHEQGIIHRDLKPANVKVRPDGRVKVLDFGLAKAIETSAEMAGALSRSPTITTPAMTQAGVILGTAAYMSPEQARGKTVDKRADIWAFGCVLYEMLAGKGPFTGPTVTDTLAAVLEREPNWDALPPMLHPRIHELLRRCLEKDPKKRRRDIADVRMEIEQVVSGSAQTVAPPVDSASPHRAPLAWIVATVLGLALTVAVAWPFLSGTAGTPETRVDISTPEAPDPTAFAISPDGRRLVFVAFRNGQTQLFLRSLDGDSTQRSTRPEPRMPAGSTSGRSIRRTRHG
jgi:eukaryotic-like serine/threonine-protein kinase